MKKEIGKDLRIVLALAVPLPNNIGGLPTSREHVLHMHFPFVVYSSYQTTSSLVHIFVCAIEKFHLSKVSTKHEKIVKQKP